MHARGEDGLKVGGLLEDTLGGLHPAAAAVRAFLPGLQSKAAKSTQKTVALQSKAAAAATLATAARRLTTTAA